MGNTSKGCYIAGSSNVGGFAGTIMGGSSTSRYNLCDVGDGLLSYANGSLSQGGTGSGTHTGNITRFDGAGSSPKLYVTKSSLNPLSSDVSRTGWTDRTAVQINSLTADNSLVDGWSSDIWIINNDGEYPRLKNNPFVAPSMR